MSVYVRMCVCVYLYLFPVKLTSPPPYLYLANGNLRLAHGEILWQKWVEILFQKRRLKKTVWTLDRIFLFKLRFWNKIYMASLPISATKSHRAPTLSGSLRIRDF